MNFKKLVSAASALAVVCSSVAAFANTTKYVGPTNAEKEIRVTDSLNNYPGWSYAADAASTSDLKLNSNGLYLLSGNTALKATGASLTFTPSAAGYSEPTAEQATADSAGGTTSFYSFTVNITNEKPEWTLTKETAGRYVAVGFDVSGTQSTTVLGKLTEGEHKVYMTYRSIPGSEDTSRDWAVISVDGTEVGKAKIDNATGIYILGPYSSRNADIQISNFRYGYVNNNADAAYTTGDIEQYKTADGYDMDATAVVLNITANETLNGFTLTNSDVTKNVNLTVNAGTTVTIGAIVEGVRDRYYLNQRFTIGNAAQ